MNKINHKPFVRKTLGWLAYLCFMISLSLLLCEGIVRIYSWLFLPKMMKADPALGWYHASNSQKVFTTEGIKALIIQNQLGHRGPNYADYPANGKKRILILGDSFTEGSHVGEQELFSNIIARNYPTLEVMNAGIGGWSTVQEYLYLQKTGIHLHPNLVLLLFFENDLDENCLSFYPSIGPRPFASMQNGQLMINETPSPEEWEKYALPLPFAVYLNRFSLAYNFFNFRVYQAYRASYLNRLEKEDLKKTETCPKVEIITRLFQKMHRGLKERGVEFAIGLIPSKQDAEKGISEVQAPLLTYCKENGIPCRSLLQPLKEDYDKGGSPYFNIDLHWNSEGHRVASEELGKFIQELLSAPIQHKEINHAQTNFSRR